MVESFRSLRKLSNVARNGDLLAPRRQVRKSNSLQPLRLCARYSEVWLRLCRGRSFVTFVVRNFLSNAVFVIIDQWKNLRTL